MMAVPPSFGLSDIVHLNVGGTRYEQKRLLTFRHSMIYFNC